MGIDSWFSISLFFVFSSKVSGNGSNCSISEFSSGFAVIPIFVIFWKLYPLSFITFVLSSIHRHSSGFLPFLLAFAAGAMIYVVVEELIPESQSNKKKDLMALFTLIGFSVMMILDVALG